MRSSQGLVDEHTVILKVLAALERHEAMRPAGPVDLPFVRDCLEFSRLYVDRCHHGKEEGCLFPCLERCGIPREGGPIGVMLADHQVGRGHVRAMGMLCDRIDRGEPLEEKLRETLVEYIAFLRAHIQKENEILYPMGEGHMEDGDHAMMMDCYKVSQDGMGEGEVDRLVALAADLEARSMGRSG